MYSLVDHTADLGIRVRAATLPELLADAGRALSEVIAGDLAQIRPAVARSFTVPGSDPVWLLHDWASALVAAFEIERLLFREFSVAVSDGGLVATARGELYDPARHDLAHEIKAVTLHGLDVRRVGGGWEGELVVDI